MTMTKPKTHATFELGEPGDPSALAALLGERLAAAEIAVSPAEDLGFAHGFRCTVGERRFYLTVGRVDDEGLAWLIVIEPALGLLRRALGQSDREEHARLALALHDALTSEERFSVVRWYNERGWNSDPEVWVERPVGE
jgi:hypothetical protein